MASPANRVAEHIELPLLEGIIKWCDQKLIRSIRRLEGYFSGTELLKSGWPNLTKAKPFEPRHPDIEEYERDDFVPKMYSSWDLLTDDFLKRVQRGDLHVGGVQVSPATVDRVVPIPSAWVNEARLNIGAATMRLGETKYGNLVVSNHPWPEQLTEGVASALPPAVTISDIPTLSDEMIFSLLEEHAKRVVENDTRMIDPHKVSLTPIILRKMQYRADHGELLQTMAAEAQALHKWIKCRLPSFQVPTPGSIENGIRDAYRKLNPRSKPMIES